MVRGALLSQPYTVPPSSTLS
ncbi:Protein of unknown function [Pyronema omphalodes CBS 100304]|uniref:Uncharacterized protein n=1 Tax=Pyronema omphalodes (strain CBS 100304) TaxID=1076935 RepID=U4L2D4_PYROM|nr:Protein of unknown function [Pyronema omphalodes CBS 100304]